MERTKKVLHPAIFLYLRSTLKTSDLHTKLIFPAKKVLKKVLEKFADMEKVRTFATANEKQRYCKTTQNGDSSLTKEGV